MKDTTTEVLCNPDRAAEFGKNSTPIGLLAFVDGYMVEHGISEDNQRAFHCFWLDLTRAHNKGETVAYRI